MSTYTYICIETETYPTDTAAELAAAKQALRDAGLESAPVYVGDPDCPDSYRGSQVLFAGSVALDRLEVAVESAASEWTGLDWSTDDEPSDDERAAVASEAARAADHGRAALASARRNDWADAVDELETAERIEREYGDSPCWRPVLTLARELAAVLTPGAEVSGPGEEDVGRVVSVSGDAVSVRWDDGREEVLSYSQLAA